MAEPKDPEFAADGRRRAQTHPRAVGSPLARGSARRQPFAEITEEFAPAAPPPPGRALPSGSETDGAGEGSSPLQKALQGLRAAIPFVQKILPLLDGNIGSALANVLNQQQPAHRPAPPVNLAPIQEGVQDLQIQHRELREQVLEQNASLRKVEDQLEMVREATDRNTLEQQELMDDLKTVGKKVNIVTLVVLALLTISLLLNLVLYLHIERVLP
jgi:hypothetical protein